MFRWVSVFLLLFCCSSGFAQAPTAPPAAQPPAQQAPSKQEPSKQEFDALQKQWVASIIELQKKSQEKAASGTQGHGELDHQIEELHAQVEGMVDKIVVAGLKAHAAGVTDDPSINSTLVSIAGFYVTGDPQGDGGDQYEKALPLIKSMLDAGLGETSPELYLWGGVSAFALNDFPTSKRYLDEAAKAGLLGNTPPGQGPSDPLNRVWVLAKKFMESFAATQQAWQKDQQTRAREAATDNLPRVKLHTTRGDIVIELFENEAPIAVANFITLVKKGYYDNVTFHRVLPAFMAQGGDPQGDGRGGPGYNIRDEHTQPNHRQHFRGSLSMAKTQAPNTGGSQFFLTFVPTSYLDGKHTVFGRVVEGMDAAAALKRRDPNAQPPWPAPDKIIHGHVLRDRGHEYKFEKLPEK